MNALSDPLLAPLHDVVASGKVQRAIRDRLDAVLRELEASSETMAWDVVPLTVFDVAATPPAVRSCWLFAIRAGAETGPERHPNSHQRSLCLVGRGTFHLHEGRTWVPHSLSPDPSAPLEQRWVTIPPATWHRLSVGPEPWGVVSFHTVPPEGLVEENPVDPENLDGRTTQEPYVGRR